MEKIKIAQLSSGLQTSLNKAKDCIRKQNTDYAIELLKSILRKKPGATEVRDLLREQEKEKAGSLGAFAKFMANIKISIMVAKGRTKLNKAPEEAMNIAEDALALNLFSPAALNLLADAAVKNDAHFVAIDSLELLHEFAPNDEGNLRKLAGIYKECKRGHDYLRTWQIIAGKHPDDLELQAELRAAAAMATMEEGKWEEEGDYQTRLKDKDQSEALEQEDRIVRNIDDIAEMTERFEERVEAGDESIDLLRKLADLYQRGGRHDDALAMYDRVIEKMGRVDPTIDRAIEKSYLAKFDIAIQESQENGASEEDIQDLVNQRYTYRLERAEDRVQQFPNDTELRFNLAVVYWDGGSVDQALEQFQIAQKNPHHRLEAVVYLGRCFHHKHQYDLSVEQYSKAIDEMLIMDKEKMNALYYRGLVFEDMNRDEEALVDFKLIYQSNVNFKDVAQRIERFYQQEKATE